MTEYFGRKGAILTTNVIPVIAWIILANVQTKHMIYIGFSLLGIWNGLTTSIFLYLAEISEPSVRGILSAFSGIAPTAGMFMIFLLGSFLSWRKVCYICTIIPIINIMMTIFVSIDEK